MKKRKIDIEYLSITLFVFLFLVSRYVCYGFKYYYQLDDYIQYFSYPKSQSRWLLIMKEGLFSSRPLACIFDLFVWGKAFNHMIICVFVISFFYSVSSVLFFRIFKMYFNSGIMFIVFYSLMPFFFEGAYWISASSRIVVGLFFLSLAVSFIQKFIEKRKWYDLFVFGFFELLAYGMYEQILVLSVTLIFIITLMNRDKFYLNFISLLNSAIYFFVTNIFEPPKTSALSSRIKTIIPSFEESYIAFFKDVLKQINTAFFDAPLRICTRGFIRGINFIFSDRLWFLIPIAVTLLFVFYKLYVQSKQDKSPAVCSERKIILYGTVLAAAPVLIFFVIDNSYFSMRNILPSFLGLGVLLDLFCMKFLQRSGLLDKTVPIILIFVCFISGISEIHDYRNLYMFDNKMGTKIWQTVKDGEHYGKVAFIIKREDEPYGNYRYHEHNTGVLSSDWSLREIIVYLSGNEPQADIVPIETEKNIYHYKYDMEQKHIGTFDDIFFYDSQSDNFIKLERKAISNESFSLVSENNREFFVFENRDIGYIFER